MILITGATGFVGSALTRQLQMRQVPFRAYTGRLNDTLQLREQLAGVTVVVHLATAEGRGSARQLEKVDVFGAEQLARAARFHHVQHLVIMSRIHANHNAIYPALRAKGRLERMASLSGVPYTLVRSGVLFGRQDHFTNLIAGLALWTWPFVWLPAGGRTPLQPLWVEDLARCLGQIVGQPAFFNQTVTLAGEERFQYRGVVRLILEALQVRRRPLRLHPQLLYQISRVLFGWQRRPLVTRFFLDQLAVGEVAPLDCVAQQFGFRPARLGQHLSHLRRPGLRWNFWHPPM